MRIYFVSTRTGMQWTAIGRILEQDRAALINVRNPFLLCVKTDRITAAGFSFFPGVLEAAELGGNPAFDSMFERVLSQTPEAFQVFP